MDDEQAYRAQFELWGEARTRNLFGSEGGLGQGQRNAARAWLAELDAKSAREAKAASDALESEKIDIARSAKDAAWAAVRVADRASIKAWIAIVISVASLALYIFTPHGDSHHAAAPTAPATQNAAALPTATVNQPR